MENIYPEVKYKLGRPLAYTPKELLAAFRDYVEWCRENPIEVTATSKGTSGKTSFDKEDKETKPRLVSIGGFLVHIGESSSWWTQLDNRADGEDFVSVKTFIREYCESFQKEMASVNLFNGNIVSRLLGIADKKEVTTSFQIEVSDEETQNALKEVIKHQ